MNARSGVPGFGFSEAILERVLGRDTPADGLLLPEAERLRVEVFTASIELDKLSALPANWDGYGAERIDSDVVKNVRASLPSLLRAAPAPEITPNPNGTISLEWASPTGVAHLEIGKTRFSFYVKSSGGRASVSDGDARGVPAGLGSLIAAVLFPPVRSVAAITKLIYTAGNERANF